MKKSCEECRGLGYISSLSPSYTPITDYHSGYIGYEYKGPNGDIVQAAEVPTEELLCTNCRGWGVLTFEVE